VNILTALVPEWRHPTDDPPPHGTKLILLSAWGVAQIGDWYAGAVAIAQGREHSECPTGAKG